MIYNSKRECFKAWKFHLTVVEDVLNQEAKLVGKSFATNNLLLNLKKGKNKLVIYGKSQKRVKQQSCRVSPLGTQ